MEIIHFTEDIKVFYLTVHSFPEGVDTAFQKLEQLFPSGEKRKLYGISYPDPSGKIIYKAAAAEKYPGEAEKYNLETFIIRKGAFIAEAIFNWGEDITQIKNTIDKLLTDSRIDKNGYCLEEYFNDQEMRCMVTLDATLV